MLTAAFVELDWVSAGYVVDDLPERLLRFNSSIALAKALVEQGRLRLGSLKSHRTHEDTRRDESEGTGGLLIPGDIPVVGLDRITGDILSRSTKRGHFNYSSEFLNPTYVFCTCRPGVNLDDLGKRFGNYIVAIENPSSFAERLFEALKLLQLPGDRRLDFLDGSPVRYDKGEEGEYPSMADHLRIDFAQKPRHYEAEQEYRFAAVLSGPGAGAPPYLDVQIARPADVMHLLECTGT